MILNRWSSVFDGYVELKTIRIGNRLIDLTVIQDIEFYSSLNGCPTLRFLGQVTSNGAMATTDIRGTEAIVAWKYISSLVPDMLEELA